MSQQDRMMQAYLERVIALRESKSRTLSEQDLRAIANEVGLSDEDLAAADQAAHEHYQRGAQFMKHGRWDDSIRELQDAVALSPGWLQYKALLAYAFAERWKQLGREPDRHAAGQLARECIAIDPNHSESYALLNTLDAAAPGRAPSAPGAVGAAPASGGGKAAGGAVLAFALLGVSTVVCMGAGMAFFLVANEPMPSEPVMISPMEVSPRDISPPAVQDGPAGARIARPPAHPQLPLAWIDEASSEYALKQTRQSVLKVYSESAFYEGVVILENTSKQKELSHPKLRVTFYDGQDQVLEVKDMFHNISGGPDHYRPGDLYPARIHHKVSPKTARVEVKLIEVKSKPAPERYEPSKTLPLTWAVPSQRTEQLIVAERFAQFKTYTKKDEGFLVLELEVKHGLDAPVKSLQVNVIMRDKQGATIGREMWYLASLTHATISPGEPRLLKRTFKAPGAFGSYEVEITKVELDR